MVSWICKVAFLHHTEIVCRYRSDSLGIWWETSEVLWLLAGAQFASFSHTRSVSISCTFIETGHCCSVTAPVCLIRTWAWVSVRLEFCMFFLLAHTGFLQVVWPPPTPTSQKPVGKRAGNGLMSHPGCIPTNEWMFMEIHTNPAFKLDQYYQIIDP